MIDSLTGRLLIAMPSIGDARFKRSVILVCAHSEDYAMGLVVNKPMEGLSLPELLDQLDIEQTIAVPDREVLDGGPVGNDRGFVLHSGDYQCDGATMDVTEDVCLTATRDVLHAIASGAAPRTSTLALGYSGWGPGQLEMELQENAWLIGQPDPQILFGEDHSIKWDLALDIIGVSSGRLQSAPGRA
ncbi:MAG: YqgE/AlgH family protein [Hyphomonadaceae bacterium]|nr:YqgE/AlgH family protein [Hyphomonadaceae bacterium]